MVFLKAGPLSTVYIPYNFELQLGVCGVCDCTYWLLGFKSYLYPKALRYVHLCIEGMQSMRGRHVFRGGATINYLYSIQISIEAWGMRGMRLLILVAGVCELFIPQST